MSNEEINILIQALENCRTVDNNPTPVSERCERLFFLVVEELRTPATVTKPAKKPFNKHQSEVMKARWAAKKAKTMAQSA